jgi:polyribonucleotide nucleotidyltransferase
MIHISKLSDERVEKVSDVIKERDLVRVKLIKIDDKGRFDLKLIKKL